VSSAAARGVPVEFVVPEEGGPNGVNVAVIPEGVDSEGCSKAFVSWLMAEDVQTSWAEGLFYFPTNEAVELTPAVQSKVHPQDESTLVQLDWPTVARNVPQTMDLWNREVLG
jgi:putative spermidine/putrescine transport system substrate-binding protein